MYSLRCKPYTNHTLNYTLRRFKPYTKTIHESLHHHTNPTQKIYTKPYTATLHRNGTQFYLGEGKEKLGEGKEKLGEGKEKFEEGKEKFEEGK